MKALLISLGLLILTSLLWRRKVESHIVFKQCFPAAKSEAKYVRKYTIIKIVSFSYFLIRFVILQIFSLLTGDLQGFMHTAVYYGFPVHFTGYRKTLCITSPL